MHRNGVAPATDAARRFLRDVGPQGARRSSIQERLVKLGDPEFQVREGATRSLCEEPWVPATLLDRLASSADPEVAWRARHIRQIAGVRHDQMLRAVATLALGTSGTGDERFADLRPVVDDAGDRLLVAYLQSLLPDPSRAAPNAQAANSGTSSVYGREALGANTLVATGARGLACEFDPAGKEVWRMPFRAWSAERLGGGRTLLASLDEQQVVEVDQRGRVTWKYGPVGATRAKPLANGHLLVTDYPAGRVLEVDRDRSVVWEYRAPDPCFDAERLLNGHTLVACANVVQEVSPEGRVVWQWQVRGRLNGLQSLPSGRLLVANYGANEVAELDDVGQVVWRLEESQPSDAFRLTDGHTLVTSATRVTEFDGAGKLVRVLTTARYGSARR